MGVVGRVGKVGGSLPQGLLLRSDKYRP
eukprot:gene26985-biopygen17557